MTKAEAQALARTAEKRGYTVLGVFQPKKRGPWRLHLMKAGARFIIDEPAQLHSPIQQTAMFAPDAGRAPREYH
jgi:hypothetical protein